LLEQKDATPEKVAEELVELIENTAMRDTMKTALARWHSPKAAEQIAEIILREVRNPDFSPLPVASATERRTEVRAPEERQLKAVA
jgi:hypothetical protein